MNSENSKTYKLHVLILNLTDKIDLRKRVASSILSIYNALKNMKSSYNNNKFKISAPTWKDKLELPDGIYSASDIQEYFEFI